MHLGTCIWWIYTVNFNQRENNIYNLLYALVYYQERALVYTKLWCEDGI